MSQSDERDLEEEGVAEATAEESEESPEVEGHKWHMGEPGKTGDPSKTFKAS